jgi:hypothetical protein
LQESTEKGVEDDSQSRDPSKLENLQGSKLKKKQKAKTDDKEEVDEDESEVSEVPVTKKKK